MTRQVSDPFPRGVRCHVVGNAALDESYAVDDLPLEGESVLARSIGLGLGGKGANQAIVLARCGMPVRFTTAIGRDARAESVRAALAVENLQADVVILPDAATDLSIILADGHGGNVVITTSECARGLTSEHLRGTLAGARPGDLLLLQGNLTAEATADMMRDATARGLQVVLNPSPVDPAFAPLLGRADTLFLNRPEARVLLGEEMPPDDAIKALHDLGARTVVLTLGSAGALLGHSRSAPVMVPAFPAAVVDPTGAGDTFQGVALASAMRRGGPLAPDDLRCAARAAAITVTRRGTSASFPTTAELAGLLNSDPD
ncbi:ribokinase [Meridianimarinicoccus roseus]|uniref:Ribokinase n=1 Tax=Meridianimarinicoccus roseus TaxID=2072018 RepID=A0A2V2LI43_9RHOB|nr:ribokinase [Meridianimarinicoccus roseus]PWR02079.1 ribokinase [Meridianimarinicoccus roseus]